MKKPTSYKESGVDIALADSFVERIKGMTANLSKGGMLPAAGGYAAVYSDKGQGRAVAITTDGVGSKLLLCSELGVYDTIGIDLVAMCANDLICVGAEPRLFLDYFACGKLHLERATDIIKGVVAAVEQCDMFLAGGETAEMPDLYAADHFDLAGFALGFVEPGKLLTGDIKAGDLVVSVASSGLHSNGYSLARKLIGVGHAMRRELLTPTALYVRPVNQLGEKLGEALSGVVNITGGGWTNLFRLNPGVGFALASQSRMPIFDAILEHVEPAEAYRTFNMGMGLALIVRGEDAAASAIAHLESCGMRATLAGRVTADSGKIIIDDTLIITSTGES